MLKWMTEENGIPVVESGVILVGFGCCSHDDPNDSTDDAGNPVQIMHAACVVHPHAEQYGLTQYQTLAELFLVALLMHTPDECLNANRTVAPKPTCKYL